MLSTGKIYYRRCLLTHAAAKAQFRKKQIAENLCIGVSGEMQEKSERKIAIEAAIEYLRESKSKEEMLDRFDQIKNGLDFRSDELLEIERAIEQ